MSDAPILPDVFAVEPRPPSPQYVNRAHAIGHPCVLFNWFCRVRWDYKRVPSPTLLRIFREGQNWHRRVAAAFAERGIEYIRQEEPMHWPDLQLSGHMDGVIVLDGQKIVPDIKSMSDYAFAAVQTLEDLRESNHWYHRAYVTQPALYAAHPQVNADWAGIYKVKRSTGETGQILWRPEDAIVEVTKAMRACRLINKAIDADARDDNGDPLAPTDLAEPGDWCDDCDFSAICPEFTLVGKGIKAAPEEVVEAVASMQDVKDQKREYDQHNNLLKKHWRAVGPGQYICGDWIAKVTEIAAKEMPAKDAYTRPGYVRTTYRRKGD